MNRLSPFNVVSLTFGFAFLYLPMLILVIFSFNSSKLVTVWAGFSTKWYGTLFQNEAFLDAAWVTLKVAVMSSTFATVLGTMAAYVLVRGGRFMGRTLFSGMIYAPLVMPEVITGLSLLLLFIGIGLDRGVMTIVLAHTTFPCVTYRSWCRRVWRPLTGRWKRRRWIWGPRSLMPSGW